VTSAAPRVDGSYAGLNLQTAMDRLVAHDSTPEFIVRQPRIYLELGLSDHVPSVVPGMAALRGTLDSLGIQYTASEYQGGHMDRVRERVSEHLHPAVGQWFRAGGIRSR
jgi:hypothetical protein